MVKFYFVSLHDFKIAKVASLKDIHKIHFSSWENYKIKLINGDLELQAFDFEIYAQNIPFKNEKYFRKCGLS